MSEKIPTMAEYAADCERVAVATLVLKQGRFPTRAEVDAELRRMNEPSVDGITRTPVISKADAAAFLKAHGVGTPNAAWAPPKQTSKATTTPDALPTNPPAKPAAKAPQAAPKATARPKGKDNPFYNPSRRTWALMKRDEAGAEMAAAKTVSEKGKWGREWTRLNEIAEACE